MKIAIFGASGYTGRLAVAEAARRGIPAVLVGRDLGRLRAAAAEGGAAGLETRTADVFEPAALAAAFRDCDAVVNCAGPFTLLGEPVVRAAIAAGSHYVDTTGEQLYVKKVFDTFAEEAERAGAAVVPGTTDDGLPSDLIARLAAARLADATGTTEIVEVVLGVTIVNGGASRGTIRSMGAIRDTTLRGGGIGYTDGGWTAAATARHKDFVLPGDIDPSPVVRFALPAVMTIPRHVHARHVEGVCTQEVFDLFAGLDPELADSVPVGPEPADRKAMRWAFAAEVTAASGRRARGVVHGSDAYGTTAVIAVEAARRLVAHGAPAGVLAHAEAFDAAGFLDFLGDHGVEWSVTDAPA